jgi:hypothetical protein
MYYKYNINGMPTQCFYGQFSEVMTVYSEVGESGEYPVLADENGNKYFEIGGKRIMFNDHICYTPSELIANLDKCRDYNLCQTLMKYGMDSLTIMLRKKKLTRYDFGGLVLSFDVSSSRDKLEDYDWVEYRFVNEDFSDPKDCYKLKMVPRDEKLREIYGSERTYVSDLISLIQIRTDLYQLMVNPAVE